MSEKPGRYQRSFPGMVGALLVLLLVIGGFVLFRDAIREDPENPVEAVELEQPVAYAREQADFDLLAPDDLPDGWIATSVRFTDGEEQSWHLGMLTDEERYVGLEQSPRPAADVVEEFVDEEATEGDEVSIDGETWRTWTDADDDLALVREDGEVTTLVLGRVSQETLEELIATLR